MSQTRQSDLPTRDEYVSISEIIRRVGKYIFVVLMVMIVIIWAWRLVSPRYTLYQANIERQVQIADARARAEAATLLAQAEVERAKGVAEANEIIAGSITDEYTRWLYVDQLDQIDGQIIYIPTEAGIPILEAGERP